MRRRKKHNVLLGALVGLAAGAGASFAMDGYWKVVQNVAGSRPEQKPRPGDDQQKDEPSTQVVADIVSEAVTGKDVPEDKKAATGVAVHYATGGAFGALFGLLASRLPGLRLAAGLLYGTGIWLFLDEIGLRVLDISPDAEKVPAGQHAQALGAHFVYGLTTAFLTRVLLR